VAHQLVQIVVRLIAHLRKLIELNEKSKTESNFFQNKNQVDLEDVLPHILRILLHTTVPKRIQKPDGLFPITINISYQTKHTPNQSKTNYIMLE